MQQNRVKKVFRFNKDGNLVNLSGDLFFPDNDIQKYLINALLLFGMKFIRACTDIKVCEVHVDKYNNVIYREYEKKS